MSAIYRLCNSIVSGSSSKAFDEKTCTLPIDENGHIDTEHIDREDVIKQVFGCSLRDYKMKSTVNVDPSEKNYNVYVGNLFGKMKIIVCIGVTTSIGTQMKCLLEADLVKVDLLYNIC